MSEIVPTDVFARLPERYQRRARQIADRVKDIDATLVPAAALEIGDELKRMRRHFRPQPDTEPAEMARGFRDACADLPVWAISEAAADFLAGRVDSHTGQFMPTCAEFAKRARSIMLPLLSERSALRVEAEKLLERAADDDRRARIQIERQDPKVRARVEALVGSAMKGAPAITAPKRMQLTDDDVRKMDAFRKPRELPSKVADTKLARKTKR